MNSRNTVWIPTEAHLSQKLSITTLQQRLSQYVICAGLGLLSGCVSVAIVIGVMIVVKAFLLSPAVVFTPHVTWLATAAILVSLITSQALTKVGQHILPNFVNGSEGQGLQIIFTVSILASLLESIILLHPIVTIY